MNKPVQVVRIYISEDSRDASENLYKEVFGMLHDQLHVKGVTVFRGVAGFGSHGEVHSADLLRFSASLPLVIEFYDEPEVIAEALDQLQAHVKPGHILTWPATSR